MEANKNFTQAVSGMNVTNANVSIAAVPEPAIWALIGLGFSGFFCVIPIGLAGLTDTPRAAKLAGK
jgi:hypothetical protein